MQALTLLNDQAFVEFAQALAARILETGPKSDAAADRTAPSVSASRESRRTTERQRLRDLLDQERAAFARRRRKQPLAAGATSKSGSKAASQLAAWTTGARVLLNLDEIITRE